MEPIVVRALVLRLRSLGESDLLVDVFSDGLGRLTCVAKGGRKSKRRFFGLLLFAHLLELQLAPTKKGGDLWRLESARLVERYLGLRGQWRRLLTAGPVLELLLRATAAMDPSPPVFNLSLLTLARIEHAPTRRQLASALLAHLTRLLSLMGFGLNLDQCLACAKPAAEISQPRLCLDGGIACAGCPPRGKETGPELIEALSAAQSLDVEGLADLNFPPDELDRALAFLSAFWQRVAGNDLPSLALAMRAVAPDRS